MIKLISFSLYGQIKKYTYGAIENAKLAKVFYPDWKVRFYINSTVPNDIILKLKDLEVEIIDMTNSKIPGVYWRFLPMDDKNIDVFISRDVDCRLSSREAGAVQQWLESGKAFHTMHDHKRQTETVLAGQWGFINSFKGSICIEKMIYDFCEQKGFNFTYGDDQIFLKKLYGTFTNNTFDHCFAPINMPNCVILPNKEKDDYFIGTVFDHKNKQIKNKINLLSADIKHSKIRLATASYIGEFGEFLKPKFPNLFLILKKHGEKLVWIDILLKLITEESKTLTN